MVTVAATPVAAVLIKPSAGAPQPGEERADPAFVLLEIGPDVGAVEQAPDWAPPRAGVFDKRGQLVGQGCSFVCQRHHEQRDQPADEGYQQQVHHQSRQ